MRFSFRLRGKFFSALLIVIAVVLVWRGLWNLFDMYIFPDMPLLSNIVGILLGVFILYLPDQSLKELV